MSIWTEELSVGNRVIDTEHKKLHDMANRLMHSIAARNVAALPEAFEQLENGLYAYFAIEERIAQAVNLDFARHRLEHQRLLNELQRIKSGLTASNCACPDDVNYARCLMDCLAKHIKEEGYPLKIVLNTHLYDFTP